MKILQVYNNGNGWLVELEYCGKEKRMSLEDYQASFPLMHKELINALHRRPPNENQ